MTLAARRTVLLTGATRRHRAGDRARARRAAARSSCSPAAAPRCSSRSPPSSAAARSRVDLADRDARRAARGGGRRRRRPRRQRGAAGQRAARRLHGRGDRPRARREPARADRARARCSAERWPSAARGHLVFISSLAGKAARAGAARSTRRRSSACAASRQACARTCAPRGVGVSTFSPASSATPGMFADSGAKLPPGVGTKTPEDVADAVVRAIERDRAEIDVAPLGAAARGAVAGARPRGRGARQRRLGASERLSADFEAGQRDKR